MGKLLSAAIAGAVALAVLLGTFFAVVSAPADPAPGSPATGSGSAIPPAWVTLYEQAAATCPGLPWAALAAIGTVESDNGQSSAPGVASGSNAAGAEGPMQFEPGTFAAYATVGPGGARPPSPYDPVDAVYTAANLLCTDGAGSPASLPAAVLAYNHSTTYVDTALTLALAIGADPGVTATVVAALTFAAAELGQPYRWGGTGPGGFDCSGLTQAAYQAAGVDLPRTAQEQFDAGPPVPTDENVLPGDLVFFGSGPFGVGHVGLYVGAGEMIDAPHTGAVVRVDDADWPDLVGATRPT
ncbi:MAG: NlpC/P60 family protein [Acidimicrobiales bacterium]